VKEFRIAALMLVGDEWTPIEQFKDECERLALTDPEEQVRGIALTKLCACYAGTNDSRIGRLVAEIVTNETLPLAYRLCAYQGLHDIRGTPVLEWPTLNPTFRFPQDVDHNFVDQFLYIT
jgi:hypothetical protein